MDKNVHPAVAAMVILATLACIALWAWGRGEAAQFGGPAALIKTPGGNFYIQVNAVLLEHDAQGEFVARHDLRELGVDHLLGEVGVFSNGDLLLRRGADNRSLVSKLFAFNRSPNRSSLKPETPDSGLHRCALVSKQCSVFGVEPIDFKETYSVAIDWETDNVYISDTTRHLLRKYSSKGLALAPAAHGFYFPNEIQLVGDQLYVADTNNHQIKILQAGNDNFGTVVDSVDVVPGVAQRAGQRWPAHFEKVGDQWWINNMQGDMATGGVYVFDENWRYLRSLDLPRGADPIAILQLADEVLISDWANDKVYRFDLNGEPLANFNSPALDEVLSGFSAARQKFTRYSNAGVATFALLVLGLLLGVIRSAKKAPDTVSEVSLVAATPRSTQPIWLEPTPRQVKRVNRGSGLALALLLAISVLLAYIIVSQERWASIGVIGPALLGLLALILALRWVFHRVTHTAIGIHGDQITLRDHAGRTSTHPSSSVTFDGSSIATPDMAVFLGQPLQPIYDRQEIMRHLFPALANARSVSFWTMQATLIRLRHPQGISTAVALAALFVGVLWMMIAQSPW